MFQAPLAAPGGVGRAQGPEEGQPEGILLLLERGGSSQKDSRLSHSSSPSAGCVGWCPVKELFI